MIEGGCFCGRVRYAIDDGAYPAVNCHCTMCRRIHAAPYVSWVVVPTANFRYLGTAPQLLQSSTNGRRYFCPSCGTHVTCVNSSHPEIVDVSLGSLDSPERFEPSMNVFEDARLSWTHGDV